MLCKEFSEHKLKQFTILAGYSLLGQEYIKLGIFCVNIFQQYSL